MANLKEGDRVQIVTREQTNNDMKERMYYPYMGGLRGTIYRLYSDGRAAVQVDLESLPEAVVTRHTQAQERMKNRWIEGLSEEARSRLTPEEREFHLNYVLLVRVEDLMPEGKRTRAAKAGAAPRPQQTKSEPSAAKPESSAPSKKTSTKEASATSAKLAASTDTEPPKRKTLKDLEKAEEEFLKSRQRARR